MEDSLLLTEEIIVILIVVFGLWLGFWVWSVDRKEKLNQWFAIMTISVVLWVVFAFLGFSTKDAFKSTFFYRLNFGAVALFLVSAFYFYIIYFLNYKEKKKYKILGKFIFSIGIVLIILSVFTDTIEPGGTEIVFGPAYILFNLYAFFIALLVVGLLIKRYFQLPQPEKLKTQYFLVGTTLFAISNVIFNIVSPIVTKTANYQHFGDYSAIFLLGFTAYAIVKRELFGIRVVLTTLLVSAIAILLGLDIAVFTTDLLIRLYKGLVLIIFLYFGYLLIRSVLREIKMREQIARAYEVEKKAREGLAKLDDVKNQFIMASQHHLRTPLTSMQGYIDLIFGGTYGEVPPRIKETLEKFRLSIKRLIRIINEFLDITQFQLGKEVVMLRPGVEIEPILDEVIEELQLEIKARGLYLKFEKPKRIPKIKADSEKLKVALFNIVDNGIKYTRQGGVTVKLKIENYKLKIIVQDTGAGIAKEDLKGLFEKLFERGQEARKVHGTGRGIGLYITSHIIKAHKGRIWAESEGKGKGSSFYIELPVGK